MPNHEDQELGQFKTIILLGQSYQCDSGERYRATLARLLFQIRAENCKSDLSFRIQVLLTLSGTDATHAEHIETIKNRNYVGVRPDGRLVPGQLGMGSPKPQNPKTPLCFCE